MVKDFLLFLNTKFFCKKKYLKINEFNHNNFFLKADDLSTHQSGEEVSVSGLNSILPKEHGHKFYNLPIIRHLEKDVCATAPWDSSIHDSIHLNKITDGNYSQN